MINTSIFNSLYQNSSTDEDVSHLAKITLSVLKLTFLYVILNYYLIEFNHMKPQRVSNNLKQKKMETKYLEQQTKKMQDKLGQLKRQIQQQKKLRTELGMDSTITRWQKTAKTNAPLKSYAKQVLQEQKQVHAQFGINPKKITGSKAFEGVLKQLKQQKQQEQQKNPTKVTTFLKQQEVTEQIQKKTVLENNFFKAKMDVKNLIKQKTLQEFLEENFILEYLNRFMEEGITDLQALRYITRQRLQQLGVKAGHQVKIIKKVKEQFEKMLNPNHQPPKPKQPTQTNVKVESGYGQGDVNTYQPQQISLELNSNIENNINPPAGQNQDESQEQRDEVLITLPMQQISLQSEEYTPINCYQCYRTINFPNLHYDEKYFCTEICMNKYLSHLKRNCPSCGKAFLKTEGYHEEGVWFCSLGCCPNHQQIEQMFFQWHHKIQ